ncbi:MAG: hypothetical protein P1U85_22945 [Verrucomicrobiales bacterium]|nr:hypothetical protein [Verrucomicrobiales bacterium]
MKLVAVLLLLLSSSAIAEITEQTKEFPHNGVGNKIIKSHSIFRDGEIVVSTVDFATADGEVNQRNHTLHAAGEMVAILEDNDADGTLNGVSVIDTDSGEMEYLYVQDGLNFIPASADEMAEAKAVGEIATSFLEDALSGESITPLKIVSLRLQVWLLKWDIPMVLLFSIMGVVGYFLGRRASKTRSEQGVDRKPDHVPS